MSNDVSLIAAIALLLCQASIAIVLIRALRRTHDLRVRVGQLGDAMTLLTETTETGFKAVATELERLGRAPERPRAPSASARITTASRRGRSVQQIAAHERVSEGEVRLRLHLAEQARPPAPEPPAPVAHDAPAGGPARRSGVRSRSNGPLRA